MKAFLRMILLLKAGLNLTIGLLMLVAPFTTFYTSLQLPLAQPGFFSQFVGLLLLGFAWLQWSATLDSRLTVAVAKVTGHLSWTTALLIPIWLYGLNMNVNVVGQTFLMIFAGLLLIFAFLELRLAKSLKERDSQDKVITKQALKQAQDDAKAQVKAQAEAAKQAERVASMPAVAPTAQTIDNAPLKSDEPINQENTSPQASEAAPAKQSFIDTIKKTF